MQFKLIQNISNPEIGLKIINEETQETFDVNERNDMIKIVQMLNQGGK